MPTTFAPGYLAQFAGRAVPHSTPGPTGYTPAAVRHAYGFDQIYFGGVAGDGSGQTIAIVDAYDDPTIAGDLVQFDRAFGLPDPVFQKVNQEGGGTPPAANPTWGVETALDVEWAHAIAPGARILLVEANSNSNADLFAAVSYAARQPGVTVVSMSWGTPEFATETASDGVFTTPAGHPGVTFLAAPGDSGAPASYPSASPNVIAVGGTTLTLGAGGTWAGESGWAGGAGGPSAYEPQPLGQLGLVPQTAARRTAPDVAYDADPATGFPIYDSYNYGASAPWAEFGGTSAATPQWAALIAIADQGRARAGLGSLDGPGQALPALYRLPAGDFHDITTGASTGTPRYAAGPGYDLVTGRGSPVANLVVRDLVNYGSTAAPGWVNLSGAATAVTSARNADGSQQVFAVGTDGALWVRTQAAGGGWGNWTSLGGTARGLAITTNAAGWQDVFVIGGSGAVWTRSETAPGVWTAWASLGGSSTALVAGRDADGTEEVFAVGTDGALWTRRQTAPWGAWTAWVGPGGTGQDPVVVPNRQGLLDLFVIGGDGAVWARSEAAPGLWTAWTSLGGSSKALAAGRDADGTEEVFAVGTDSAVWTRRQTAPGVWTTWVSLGGVGRAVALAPNRQGLLDLFVPGGDGAAWTRSETAAGQWAPWTSLGGLVGSLAAGLDSSGRPEVLAQGPDGTLWWKDQNPGGLWV